MSRLRSPTSASTSTTLAPDAPSAAPTFAVVVVFPTPPLPLVTTIARPRARGTALAAGASSCVGFIATASFIIHIITKIREVRIHSSCFPEEPPEETGRAELRERDDVALQPARDL